NCELLLARTRFCRQRFSHDRLTQVVALAERLVDRRTLLGKKLRTVFRNVKTIFQTNAKLSVDHNRWFVAETHARLNSRLVPAAEVRPFMSVQAYAVTSPMRQPRHFVVRSKPGIRDRLSCRRIDRFARRPNPCRGKTGILRLVFKAPDVALALRC